MVSIVDKGRFQQEGFVTLSQLIPTSLLESLSDEIVEWQNAAVLDTKNIRYRFKNRQGDGNLCLDTIDPALDLFPSLKQIANHPDLLKVLYTLFGEPACLFKDKLILKSPGVDGYPLHQDYIAWPNFPRSFTTVVIPIDEANEENGCIEVFANAHHFGYLSATDGDFHDLPETAVKNAKSHSLKLAPGDVSIFGCFVPHRSAANRSGFPRRQIYLSYNKASDRGEARSEHYQEFHSWLLKRYEEFGAKDFYFK